MAIDNIRQVLTGEYAYLQGADTSSGTKPHITAAEWTQFFKRYLTIAIPADAMASDTNDYGVFYNVPAITVTNAYLIADGSLTASASVYATLTLQKIVATVATTISTLTTNTTGNGGTGNWAAKAAFTFTTAAAISVAAGSTLNLNIAKASTGTALKHCLLTVEYYLT